MGQQDDRRRTFNLRHGPGKIVAAPKMPAPDRFGDLIAKAGYPKRLTVFRDPQRMVFENANTEGVAVTADGKFVYVANFGSRNISVIATASNTVTATVAEVVNGTFPEGVAVTPDGKFVYVTNVFGNSVSVIATASNTMVTTVGVGSAPEGVAVTPDGKFVYVANEGDNTVSVIATASNTVTATVGVGSEPFGVAVTPDGKFVYVSNRGSANVSVIATANHMVTDTATVGSGPSGVGIIPDVPFLAFGARLQIDLDRKPKEDRFELKSNFTLSSTAPGIHPVVEPVTLQIGTFSITIPPGSFTQDRDDDKFKFEGKINGVRLEVVIRLNGTLRYSFHAEAKGADLTGTKNPVTVRLSIGADEGITSVNTRIASVASRNK